jgi:hypothetical protein
MLESLTELEAINQVLGGIGETPVSSLANTGITDMALARQMLTNVSRQVQSKGWHWNTDPEYTLVPTLNDKFINLPANALRVDTVREDSRTDVVKRGTRLYDRQNSTYQFERSLKVSLTTFLPFDELPEPAKVYITMLARRRYQEDQLGSSDLSSFHKRDELQAWADLLHAEAEDADYNMKMSPDIERTLLR